MDRNHSIQPIPLALWSGLLSGGVLAFCWQLLRAGNRITYPHPSSLVHEPDLPVSVTRVAQGLRLRWHFAATQLRITCLKQGDSPTPVQAVTLTGQSEYVWRGLQPEYRYFFELSGDLPPTLPQPLVFAERVLPLVGGHNCRDIGGYPTTAGQTVRWGQVYRSGDLATLTQSDQAYLSRLGVQLVCDLRDHAEQQALPDLPIAGAHRLWLPIYPSQTAMGVGAFETIFMRAHLPAQMQALYIEAIDHHAHKFGAVLTQLANPANRPLLYHCTAGKDRTGIVTALLLSVLGVPDTLILADYSLSNWAHERILERMRSRFALACRFGVKLSSLQVLWQADLATLQAALDHIRSRYGSVTDYLLNYAGVVPATLAQLRADLLV